MTDPGAPQAALATLRGNGDWRVDPLRFAFLEALARRMDGQPAAVRSVLEERLLAGIEDYAQRVARRQQLAGECAERLLKDAPRLAPQVRRLQASADLAGLRRLADQAAAPAATALGELVNSLRSAAQPEGAEQDELVSARRFRQSWERQRRLEQVDRAVARKPANPGPLNSHALVVQALETMRELSPEYLRHFVAYVETLQGLEPPAARPPAVKKTGKPRGGRR